MLPADDLTLAIDIQSRSYKLLRWVATAIEKGFIPATRAHEYADVSDSALDWVDQHYLNFPAETRPERRHLRQFANFFSTYVISSFDVIEQPGTRLESRCGCYCPLCRYIVRAPHLQPKKLSKRDKTRAVELMVARVTTLALEEGIYLKPEDATAIVQNEATRRFAGYSAYGCWLINRMEGLTDGQSILALWREIAWHPTGSPRKNFQLAIQRVRPCRGIACGCDADGIALTFGKGVSQDLREALELYKVCMEGGFDAVELAIERVKKQLRGSGV